MTGGQLDEQKKEWFEEVDYIKCFNTASNFCSRKTNSVMFPLSEGSHQSLRNDMGIKEAAAR